MLKVFDISITVLRALRGTFAVVGLLIASLGVPPGACPRLPCAWGDVFDRLTILRLKSSKFTDAGRLRHTLAELAAVEAVADLAPAALGLMPLVERLAAVNSALWDTEDAIHARERAGLFDQTFIDLARAVIHRNDERAAVKREISLLLGSALIEEKLYGAE